MKRSLVFLFIAMLLAATGCRTEHEHIWDGGQVIAEPTCADDGETVFTCTLCGAVRTDVISHTGHSYDGTGMCVKCHNYRSDIESAEARVGLKYFSAFPAALHYAIGNGSEKPVEVLKSEITFRAHEPQVNGSVTVNANNADFGNCDIAIYTYGTVCTPKHGEISIVINNARNLTVWGDGKLIEDGDDVRITLNGCSNSGVSPVESSGELVMLRSDSPSPAGSSLSITLNDCAASNADLAIHSTFADKVMISGCRFSECAVPVNLNYKKADGAMSVTIKDSVFSSCGVTEAQSAAIAAYSAPVRIVNQSGRAAEVMIEGISVLDTKSALGDVLITDVRSGSALGGRIIASFVGNSSDLSVRKSSGDDGTVTVLRGEQKTVYAGLLF